jgi:8-oxo-dGTP diphosphatase
MLPSTSASVSVDTASRRRFRIGAKGLITTQDRVLLIKERHADGSHFWTLPGGGIEDTESLSDCLRREIEEEIRSPSDVRQVVDAFVYRHTSRPTTTIYAVFDATLQTEPDPNPGERIVDHAWRKPTDLPSTTLDPVEHVIQGTMTERNRG